jgi:hypothetical protein
MMNGCFQLNAWGFNSLKSEAEKAASTTGSAFKTVGSVANSALSAVGNTVGSALTAISQVQVVNQMELAYSTLPISVTYSGSIPRVTQADWFDPSITVTWDLKPDQYYSASGNSNQSSVNFVAYFPADFYVRTDLTQKQKK